MDLRMAAIQAGSRELTDGTYLRWRLLMPTEPSLGAALPFFIDWSNPALHPSNTLPIAGELSSFRITHPAARKLRAMIGDGFEIMQGEQPELSVQIEGRNGPVTFRTPSSFPPGVGNIIYKES
jgi:hypothetical protein